MAGSIFIPLISVFDAKGIRDAKSGMAALGGMVKSLKGTATAAAASFAAVKIGDFVQSSVTEARNLERNMVGLGNVFGGLAPEMQQFAKDASAIGLSQVDASKASTFLGSVLKQSGFSMDTVAGQTKNLVGLASDLAATYGYDVSEALTGMTALFRGEYDPIEKFGVAMKQSEVNALLAARGQKNLTGATLRHAQAQARLDILYARSTDAQGAYAKQSGSLFVAQTQLKAAFDNMKASVGASLTGPIAALASSFVPIVDVLGKVLAPLFNHFGKSMARLAPLIYAVAETFLALIDAVMPIINVLMELITPLLNPLVGVFKLITSVIKPLIPVIAFLCNVLAAVLLPIVTGVNIALSLLLKGFIYLFDALASIPGLGDAFKGMNDGLKSFTTGLDDANKAVSFTTDSGKLMADQFSKKIPSNSIDGIGSSINKVGKTAQDTAKKVKGLLDDALNVQKSFIDATDITGLLDSNNKEIVSSITYIDGKFRTVIASGSKSATDLASVFKNKLYALKDFYKNITKLDNLGLNAELITQISSAGVEAGGATAKAILETGVTGVESLNKTFAGIKNVAGNIGVKVAKVMQNTGSDIGNGLIDGLMAQSERLNTVAVQMGKDFADSFNKGTKTQPSTKIETIIPKGYSASNVSFLGSKKALAVGQKSLGPDAFNLVRAPNIANPFVGMKNPYEGKGKGTFGDFKQWADTNLANQKTFQKTIDTATKYNITIQVAPGATTGAINDALIAAIQEYERKKGKIK